MPGFNIALGKHNFPIIYLDDYRLSCDSIVSEKYDVRKFTLKKFENDNLFVDIDEYLLVLEGVILNKKDFLRSERSWEETVISLYKQKGDNFFGEFRGSFSGALFDKTQNKWIIFTDHIGSKQLYYSKRGEELYLTSEITDLYALFKEHGLNYSLDEQGAYMLLSYGYMLNNYTLCNEIKKLKPGCYIKYENNNFSTHQYYTLPDKYDESIDEVEAIEQIDELFRNAIKLQFDKDKEYGHKHLVALSGGLDSRMTSWVAHEMGYKDQLNFTFSQGGYLDETIAKEIASDLKHEWIFKALDNGNFLTDIDEINKLSGGNTLFYGLAHGNSALKYINFNELGILHSGQLGDIIISSFEMSKSTTPKPNSYKYIYKIETNNDLNKLSCELTNITERGFNSINLGLLPAQKYTETHSPFYDVDFIDYCFKIPLNHRINHNLYKKWVLKKYPGAADYIWESTKSKITDKYLGVFGKEIPIKQLPNKILRKLGFKKNPTDTAFHMNPLGYWYKTNPDLKEFQDNYFNENIERLDEYKEIKKDCIELYQTGNGSEKNQVLTLLSALKLFFN